MELNRQGGLADAGSECQAGNVASTDLRSVLRARQQARNRKSCLPCRERKVRCNRDHPCLTCCKRGHPDLCHYQDVRSQQLSDQPTTHATTAHRGQARDPSNTPYWEDAQNSPTMGNGCTPSPEEARTNPSLLGGRSILALTRENSVQPQDDPDRQRAFETGLLPLLGIDGERHPGSENNPDNCSYSSLPRDEELIKLFAWYRDRVYPLHFAVLDLQQIEKSICAIILARGPPRAEDRTPVSGGAHLLGLLHAILACGAQFSDLPAHHRLAQSQKHAKHAFDALRVTDYLLKPCEESLQTLILLGNVLQNNMNPRAAWILGGTTIRLALSLGIQGSSGRYQSAQVSPQDAKFLRQGIVWQDTLLSLAFDRPASSHELDFEHDLPPLVSSSVEDALLYRHAMHWLCHLSLRHFSLRTSMASMETFFRFIQDMDLIDQCLAPHLKSRENCSSIQEIEEHYSFELHKNFSISTLCRPIISKKFWASIEPSDVAVIMATFQTSLRRSARAFIQLHSITSYARRSWAFIHNGLTAALLLSFMADTRNTPETKEIQTGLTRCLTEEEQDFAGSLDSGTSSQLSNSHKKSLQALRTLSQLSEEDRGHGDNSSLAKEASDAYTRQPPTEQETGTQGNLDMDDWLRSYDFDSYSPLQVFDFIMSDQDTSQLDLRSIGIS